MNKILLGFGDVLRAFSFVFKNRLWWTFLVPILFSGIMVFTLFKLSDDFVNFISGGLIDYLGLHVPQDSPVDFWEKCTYWLKLVGEYAIYGVLYVLCYLIFFKIQKYIILIFMAPFIAWISEKAEEIIMQNSYQFSFKLLIKDIWRGIRIAIKNLTLELLLLLIIGIVVSSLTAIFAPLAIIAAPLTVILSFMVSAYYYGFSSFDYLNERNRLSISAGNRLIWDNRLLVVGNGSFFGLMMLIPFVGVILAPVLCPIGAVISSQKLELHKKTA